jgi:hypothetical protein
MTSVSPSECTWILDSLNIVHVDAWILESLDIVHGYMDTGKWILDSINIVRVDAWILESLNIVHGTWTRIHGYLTVST